MKIHLSYTVIQAVSKKISEILRVIGNIIFLQKKCVSVLDNDLRRQKNEVK